MLPATRPETLLSRVDDLLSMTNPDGFHDDFTTADFSATLDSATMDLHLHHMAKLLTDTTALSLFDNVQQVPITPSSPTSSSPTGKTSPRKRKLKPPTKQLPMERMF